MKPPIFLITAVSVLSFSCSAWGDVSKGGKIDGKAEFEKHCSSCHENGGNTINRNKTLKKQDMQANGVRTARDIVKLMRRPGPGMTTFDRNTIDDKEAKAIAEYVLKAFR